MKKKINKNTRYICLFLTLFTFIIVFFYMIYVKHRNTVEEQQKNQLGVLATTGANYVQSYLEEQQYEFQNVLSITKLGDTPKQIEQQVTQKIKLYWSIALTYLDYLEYFSLDRLPIIEIAGLKKEDINHYTKLSMMSNEVVIGPWVTINSDNNGIYIFKGIFNENGKHGVVVGRIDLKMAFKKTIGQMSVGSNGYFTLGDINNNKLLQGGSHFYQSSSSHTPHFEQDDPMINGYSFINFGEHNLLVSTKLPYYEIEQPIKLTFYFLIGLSIGLFLLFVFITFTLVKMNRVKIEHSLAIQYQEELYALNQNATLGFFSREIAHDYNNLLTPIQIYCELLEDELKDNEELSDYINEVNLAVNQCKRLASRLLSFGSNKTSSPSYTEFDSIEVIQSSIKRLRTLIPASIQLDVSLPTTKVLLYGEQLELVQILFNLCLNGVHAMEETGGTLSIHYSVESPMATLIISDTGSGMSEETKRQIFTSGFTTKKEGQGNGLGLAIVAKTVEKFGGTITLTSTLNVGTTFTIQLPYKENC
ncbi:MAG: HAMP domain-containing sensor histidine kinase [bacterium]|nr:HAMP domain-containing sensor histidine kinase [bacterium]